MSNDPEEPNGPGGRNYPPIGGGTSVNIQGLSQATSQINAFNAAISTLQSSLTKMAQSMPGQASTISSSLNKMGQSASGGGGFMSTMGNIPQAMFGAVNEKGWARDLLMFPTRFMRSAVSDNRTLALQASGGLGMQAFGAGVGTQGMMGALAGQFGNVMGGNPADLVNLMNAAGSYGAGIDWRNLQAGSRTAAGGPRSGGFFRSVFEAQRMSPSTDVGSLAGAIGGYAGNVGAQQQSAFLTGGAFSMIGAGNRQKSISEWATGILKWLQNIRGGQRRGQAFTYPELLSQNFPGSNIDAWLTANGVTPDMKQFFWTYALAQSGKSQSEVDQLFTKNAATDESVAFTRLKASAAQTRTGFRLAGQMSGAYANKEQANQFFAEMTGHLLNQVLPAAMSTGALSYMQYLPDTVEEIIMQLAERTGLGTLGAGVVGWGGSGVLQNLLGAGDVGDVGDYGSLGSSSSAGLHPDMRKRVDAMMAANPNIRVTSGHRDLAKQQTLKRRGVGRVSGRPSAHTRGMAADLGPASQYGWISRNASRFGMSSGRGQGEPWHVGMAGDVGDPLSDALAKFQAGQGAEEMNTASLKDTLGSFFGSLFQSFTGVSSPESQIAGIGKASSWLMKGIMGAFGGQAEAGRLAYRDVYSQMVAAANAGGLPTGLESRATGGGWLSGIFSSVLNSAQGVLGGSNMVGGAAGTQLIPNSPMAGGGTLDAFFGDVLTKMGYPNTANNRTKLAAIAKIEGNQSGTYNPFNTTGGSQFPKFNSVGVRNYPDWATGVEYTAKQLNKSVSSVPGGPEMGVMRGNLSADGTYNDWIADAQAFYRSWKGYDGANLLGNIPAGKASEMLTHQINAGDVENYYGSGSIAPMAAPRMAPMIFQNTFRIEGGGGSTGIDVKRTATLLADQLEQQMQQRMARRN